MAKSQTVYRAAGQDGAAIEYVDRKRRLWLLSVLYPLQPFAGIALHAASGDEIWLLLPLLLNYGLGPVLDWITGEDRHNPPEDLVMQMDRDPYYRRLTYAAVPLHYVTLFGVAGYAVAAELSAWAFVGLAVVAGLTGGLAINTGHELGHKNTRLERWLAKLALALPAYGHFTIAHNVGHHRDVATPGDPASSRMGESIYRFALREMPGAFLMAWKAESARLRQRGRSTWHPANRILQSWGITTAVTALLLGLYGWKMLPFLAIHHLFAWWGLTSANYVEHYGLLRQRDAAGKYEPCRPYHSWNSNHLYSNLLLFHLERHSDHHANPQRRYQSLRHFDDLPRLPSGYFGVYLLAYVPWLWFRVMDRRLLALSQVRGDIDRVNVDPRARASLFLRYGRDKMIEPTL